TRDVFAASIRSACPVVLRRSLATVTWARWQRGRKKWKAPRESDNPPRRRGARSQAPLRRAPRHVAKGGDVASGGGHFLLTAGRTHAGSRRRIGLRQIDAGASGRADRAAEGR